MTSDGEPNQKMTPEIVDNGDIESDITALGIKKSESNHLVDLWNIHCSDVSDLEFKATDFEELLEEDQPESRSDANSSQMLSDIYATINSHEPEFNHRDYDSHERWLEKAITQLNRACSEVELHLRNKNRAEDHE